MEKMYQFTRMSRAIDPRYPTNLAIIIWTVVVAVAMFIFQIVSGMDFVSAGIASILGSGSVVLTWIIAREIDPEEQLSAFVGVLLMSIAVFVMDVQFNLIVLFYISSMSRIVNRTIGPAVTLLDSIFLLMFTAFVGFAGSWIYAMMGATAFLLDSLLPDRDRKHLVFAGLATVIMVAAFLAQSGQLVPILPTTEFIIGIIGVTFIFVPVVLKSRRLTVVADMTSEPCMPIRVQAAQVLALLFGYHVALWQGNLGILELLPLWTAIAGVSLFPLVKPFLPDWDLSPRS